MDDLYQAIKGARLSVVLALAAVGASRPEDIERTLSEDDRTIPPQRRRPVSSGPS